MAIKQREVAMPMVMATSYVPEIVATEETQNAFLAKYLPISRVWKRITEDVLVRIARDTQNRVFFFSEKEGRILYLMHLNPIKLRFVSAAKIDELKNLSVYQGSVWRNPESSIAFSRLPSFVFWEIHKKSSMVSDSTQSLAGRAFWVKRLEDALNSQLSVYAIHFNESGSSVVVDESVRLHSLENTDRFWSHETKKDDSGLYWRFLIP